MQSVPPILDHEQLAAFAESRSYRRLHRRGGEPSRTMLMSASVFSIADTGRPAGLVRRRLGPRKHCFEHRGTIL